jgi:hypothetical protein
MERWRRACMGLCAGMCKVWEASAWQSIVLSYVLCHHVRHPSTASISLAVLTSTFPLAHLRSCVRPSVSLTIPSSLLTVRALRTVVLASALRMGPHCFLTSLLPHNADNICASYQDTTSRVPSPQTGHVISFTSGHGDWLLAY